MLWWLLLLYSISISIWFSTWYRQNRSIHTAPCLFQCTKLASGKLLVWPTVLTGTRLVSAILKILYVRVFTNMVTTNWIMEAVFDAADDTLKVKKESGLKKTPKIPNSFGHFLWAGSLCCWSNTVTSTGAGKHVEEAWAKLTKGKRKKKKKKTLETNEALKDCFVMGQWMKIGAWILYTQQ